MYQYMQHLTILRYKPGCTGRVQTICISLARIHQGDYELNINVFMLTEQKKALLSARWESMHHLYIKLGTLPPVPDFHCIISKQEELNVILSFKRQAESLSSEKRAFT